MSTDYINYQDPRLTPDDLGPEFDLQGLLSQYKAYELTETWEVIDAQDTVQEMAHMVKHNHGLECSLEWIMKEITHVRTMATDWIIEDRTYSEELDILARELCVLRDLEVS